MEKSFEKHPAYEEEDLKIKNSRATGGKKRSGVAKSHEEVMGRFHQREETQVEEEKRKQRVEKILARIKELGLKSGESYIKIHLNSGIIEEGFYIRHGDYAEKYTEFGKFSHSGENIKAIVIQENIKGLGPGSPIHLGDINEIELLEHPGEEKELEPRPWM